MKLWPVLRGAVVAEKKIFTGGNCRVIVKPTFWNKEDPNTIKNGKHVAHNTQLLILSPSVTWNKLPVGGKVLTDEMTPVIDHYGWNEEYRTLAISHYTWEFGKKEERQEEGKKGPALRLKFSAQGMGRRLQSICYCLLQPQNWHTGSRHSPFLGLLNDNRNCRQTFSCLVCQSWNIFQEKVESWLRTFWWNPYESEHSTTLKPGENSSHYKTSPDLSGNPVSKEKTALLLYLIGSTPVTKGQLL